MKILELILLFVLQLEGISGEETELFYTSGDDAVLRCMNLLPVHCPTFDWFYSKHENTEGRYEVQSGIVDQSSPRAARMSLNRDCSLNIRKLSAEDAGSFTCGSGDNAQSVLFVYLNILTVSPSPPDLALTGGDVTLKCSLRSYRRSPCSQGSIIWVDESGNRLNESRKQDDCVSYLTVEHQRGRSKKITCQFIKDNRVKTDVHYTAVFTDPIPDKDNIIIIIIIVPVVGGLLLLVVAAAVFIKWRNRTDIPEDQTDTADAEDPYHHYDEIQTDVTYATVDLSNPKASSEKKVKEKEEVVSYSALRTKTEADIEPNSLYSCVNKPQ